MEATLPYPYPSVIPLLSVGIPGIRIGMIYCRLSML